MRTTITVDRQVMEQLKERSAQAGGSVSRLIEQALRLFLRAPASDAHEESFELVTFGADGRFSGYNLDKASVLFEAEDLERYGNRR